MNKNLLNKAMPHLIAIIIFLIVSVVYCLPIFQGLVVNQHDMLGTRGMVQQSLEFQEKYGHVPLWTNSLYSGMPAYQILIGPQYNIGIGWLHNLFTFFLPYPAGLFFLSCICFYILSQVLRLKPWVGILGSLAYAFASYSAIIMVVGHITKFATMGYAPAVLAGIILLMQRKYIAGFALTLLFTTLFFNQNHVQAVYYYMILILCLGITFLIKTIQTKDYKHFFKTAGLAIVAFAISACSFAVIMLPTNEYAKETMRGGRSELTLDQQKENKSEGGLDKDYAFRWSYGKEETLTFILPNYFGSSNDPSQIGETSHIVQALQESRLPQEVVNYFYSRMSPYWGSQPNTAGPVYFGAIICMLFVAGLFFVPKKYLCWLIPGTILTTILAWGSNLSTVNYFLFDHLPYLNKFRAPSMALMVPQLSFAIVASLAAQQIFYGNLDKAQLFKKLKFSAIAFAALLFILVVVYVGSSFKSENDDLSKQNITQQLTQMMSQGQAPTAQMNSQASSMATTFFNALAKDRQGMYGSDLVRLFIYALLGGALIWLGSRKKIKPTIAIGLLAAISFIDLITVDSRYLNKSHYVSEDEYLQGFIPTSADLEIKRDTSYYRVVDQTMGNPFDGNARASYFHNSLGGYSPAKLGLYQDLIEHQLGKGNMQVFNMLNAKYFISNDPATNKAVAQLNPAAFGPAWFVKAVKFVNNANEEMQALDSLQLRDTAVADKREQAKITAPEYDSSASITLIKNLNDEIIYQSKTATNQFAVFSEIYYPYGWNAYIDGKETPVARVNYTLRGLNVPAGNHTIRFVFEPKSYKIANYISLVAGVSSILLLLVCGFLLYRQNKKIA